MHINEIARLSGVTVRTLHYYDEIGLLTPPVVDERNGYRSYDEKSLERLQEILFYRELDFSLKAIAEILSSPKYDKSKALSEQKHLLTLKKQRLERLIAALDNAVKGEISMSFKALDNSEYEAARDAYAAEAKERWGDTDAYKESQSKGYSKDKQGELEAAMAELIKEFALLLKSDAKPEDAAAQELVRRWQSFITESYYNCTKEILAGLGLMYSADERFKENMDRFEAGTAKFMSAAIAVYCE